MKQVAYVFPGQGSQSKGMLAELAQSNPEVLETFEEASEVLGYDLWDLVQNDEDGSLNQTHITQPALLTASVAIYRVLAAKYDAPAYMAGHSLGEYSALVCAGVLDFKEAVSLVQSRGLYMQSAVPEGEGAMYAIIGLADDKIQAICEQVAADTSQVISPVNYNSPGQVVIAGNTKAAELAAQQCKEAGAKRALPLAVSAPSHCALMKPAAAKLEDVLNDISFSPSEISIVNNVDVSIESDSAAIKDALVRQLYCPVQWTRSVEQLIEKGVTQFVEVGPGKVLSGLIKRVDKTVKICAANTPDSVTLEFE
ncbi:ACP S-malonyltransferase [Alteromonas sp. 5E99-2]|uniref:ACP S-malonyltransferase n=1 Tax=Alteromonas sp. 5E99-2 TaxID=2817683 RepID=UPI001A99A47A|nr:ACP S-malonyltransferase [Alteromonas sp. 5E99-2]MBO1254961.1 ACP S-malonyltransferase [Alteromonas sp. 5E99-2]